MILEFGVLAALGAMLCWGIGDFFIQKSTRESGDIESLAFVGIIGTAMLLPFALQELPLLFSIENLQLLFAIGIVTLVAALLDFEALKQGKLSVVEVVLEIELPITAVLGLVFFAETISTKQAVLILLILAGIGMISLNVISRKHYLKKFEKGVFLAVVCAAAMAFLNFFTAAGARKISPIMVVWVPAVIFTIICLFFICRHEGLKKMAKNFKRYKGTILGMGVFDTLAWVFFATAVAQEELAITTAITEAYPAIAMFLGVTLGREKIKSHQYAGAALALIACLMLAMTI